MINVPLARMGGVALAATLLIALPTAAQADATIDWNVKASELVADAKLGTPPAVRVLAIAHTAAYEALSVLDRTGARTPTGPAADVAIAAAHRVTLTKLLPSQKATIEAVYGAVLAQIEDGPARQFGIEAGERAAADVLARRSEDSSLPAATYRPHSTAGAWVPTAEPAALQWPQRKPWLMKHAAQFRPGSPTALGSDNWARDYNEVKAIGARASRLRTAEQTEIARFWEYSMPSIYYGVVQSVAQTPGRDALRNARLYAAVAQAMDDAMIGVFDSKYHYLFWRPATAIRNGDLDGNSATERDPSWSPLSDAPLHPEYPSAHSILAAAVGTVLSAEIGAGPAPVLATTSPTAKGVVRRWRNVEDFIAEVANARVYEGIHFRTSTEVGIEMGRRIGQLAVTALLEPQP